MSKIKTTKVIVLEYSVKNKAANVSTLAEAMRNNMDAAVKGYKNDYLIVGVFDTYNEACEACDKLLQRQEEFREQNGFDDFYLNEEEEYDC